MRIISENEFQIIKNSLSLIRSNTIKNSNNEIQISSGINIDISFEILYSTLLKTKCEFERTRKNIIRKAVYRWIKYKLNKISDNIFYSTFERALYCEYRIYHKFKTSKFNVLMFLNIDQSTISGLRKIKIFEDIFEFIPWSRISKMDTSNLWYEINYYDRNNPLVIHHIDNNHYCPDYSNFYPILASINATSADTAVDIANNKIDIIRAIFNINLLFGKYTIFKDRSSPNSKILPSPIYIVFNSNGKRDHQMYSGPGDYFYRKTPIDAKYLQPIKKFLNKYRKAIIENSSWKFIFDILIQYQNALDFANVDHAFLGMWQVLENCIGFGERLEDNKVIQTRISNLIKPDQVTIQFLEICRNQRNEFVHKGKYINDIEKYLYILKILTDIVIKECVSIAYKFKTKNEMKEYITSLSLNDSELRYKRSAINKLILKRK